MTAISVKNVNKEFGSGTNHVKVLNNIDFAAEKGELNLVIGPSGSGKSTFLTIAGGLQTPTSGDIYIDDQQINGQSAKSREKTRLQKIGFVLQSYNLVPYLTVKEQFTLVDRVNKGNNLSKEELQELLETLGIANLVNKYPSELSGGQSQRVAIARALYTNPEIVLADEPTAALDSARVIEVGKLMRDLAHKNNKAIVVVTHDHRLEEFADNVYEIMDGNITKQ
ncbi:peptide ABC transporter ATP-binding protein [Lentilactobacillus curieae]|uniref:Putative hemin import ATP-binding protein HrtA n=1 Tax=Lentilactobacillus curieae TaxID=1138822 RepID=A0A1S6QIS3_9LACO|nr:ABC transporter ATP-binding protein [Lentilactobacillus curieae]AQW21501.1 peptide ABC transporter ATP-binding protein [Lentilactobacillus curieae]